MFLPMSLQNQNLSLVLQSCRLCRTRVVSVAPVSHLCRTRVARVSLVSHLCC